EVIFLPVNPKLKCPLHREAGNGDNQHEHEGNQSFGSDAKVGREKAEAERSQCYSGSERVMFDSDQEMSVTVNDESKTDPVVTINEDADLMFIMTQDQFDQIRQYYQKINENLQKKEEEEFIAHKKCKRFSSCKAI